MDILGIFWNFIAFLFWPFVLVAYLIVLFSVAADLLRDQKLTGSLQAMWLVFLIFVPVIAVLVYVIARSTGRSGRRARGAGRTPETTNSYMHTVATTASPSEELSEARQLLAAGTITRGEFAAIKANVLGTEYSDGDLM